MKIGQFIGAGFDSILLFCQIESIDATGIHVYVINGGWNITFRSTDSIIHHNGHNFLSPYRIIYTGYIPRKLRNRHTYADAIDYIQNRIDTSAPVWSVTVMSWLRHLCGLQ